MESSVKMFRSLLQTVPLLRLLVFVHRGFVGAQLTCYNPDGTENDVDTPCDPYAEVTHCCGSDSLCLDNKLCWEQQYSNLNQGSCTDSSWSSSECFTNSEGEGAMCDVRKFCTLLSPLSHSTSPLFIFTVCFPHERLPS